MPETAQRFVFDDRPLGDWLLQLVDQDPGKRKTAAKVISDRFYMPIDLLPDTERGVEAFLEEFSAAVRHAVNAPAFPAADFVQHLLSLELAFHESWCAQSHQEHEREEQTDQADLAKLGNHPTDAATKRYVRRVWIRLLRDCKRISQEEPHEVFTTGAALTRVIQSLGEELLPAADILRAMLSSRHKANVASEAIARMGRPGLVFYETLLQGLKRDAPNYYHSKALGTLLRAAPEKVPQILQLACEKSGSSRAAAIHALGTCGLKATEVCPEVETRLRDMLDETAGQPLWYAVASALGQTARTDETATCLLNRLDTANPAEAGQIILALGTMTKAPERVIPRLAELLDTFVEYDPDWSYHGEHERVVQALTSFGPAAAPAIPRLIAHIWTKPHKYWTKDRQLAERPDPDETIIKLLGKLGPLASDALPALLEVQREMNRRVAEETETAPQSAESPAEPPMDSYIDIAFNKIRGHVRDDVRSL